MKLEDYIQSSIANYPSLYAGKDYASSRLLVLNHIFLTLGGGLEWANTGNSKTGGYLVAPSWYKRNGEWHRKKDLPYGKEIYNGPAIERFFEDEWVELKELQPVDNTKSDLTAHWLCFRENFNCNPVWKGFISEIPEDLLTQSIGEDYIWEATKNEYILDKCTEKSDLSDKFDTKNPKYLLKKQTFRHYSEKYEDCKFTPCPFSEKYWAYANIDPMLVQLDWLHGMIEIKEAALEFYETTSFNDAIESQNGWRISDFERILQQYANQKKTINDLLTDYEMTYETQYMEAFRNVTFETILANITKYGTLFAHSIYERDRSNRINILKSSLEVLRQTAAKKATNCNFNP